MNTLLKANIRRREAWVASESFQSCILRAILIMNLVIMISPVTAQSWQQLGPGAGGQERALYLHKNLAGNYVLYVGSDVSGVWRSHSINPTELKEIDQYNYEYISNHRIFRFVNKFYRPAAYTSKYLFTMSRVGIDRINLNDESEPMKPVNLVAAGINFEESWVSDIYIGPENNNGKHIVYFTTGNTRVNEPNAKNHKDIVPPMVIDDLYLGELNQNEDEISNITSVSFPFSPASTYHDVFCLYVDEGLDPADPADDIIYAGSDDRFFKFTSGIVSTITLPGGLSTGKITSIQEFDPATLLITIHGAGIYSYDKNSGNWVDLMSVQYIMHGGSPVDIHTFGIQNTLDFTQLFQIKNNGTIQGYLAVNEIPKVKLGTYLDDYIGLFFSNANPQGLPDGIWTALDIDNSSNDWGWNKASPPCANINGAVLTEKNVLFIGKQGNIFNSGDPVSATNSYLWKQIYTTENIYYDPPCVKSGYRHRGYVNTALTSIFPQGLDMIWETQYDRLMWYDGGIEKSYIQVTTQNSLTCYNVGGLPNPPTVSDAFFVKEYASELYAGVAEGFAGTQGNGYLIKNVPPSKSWTQVHSAINGDPLDYFNIGGVDYLFAKPAGSTIRVLYFWDANNWIELPGGWPWGTFDVKDVKMITVGSSNYFVILAKAAGGNQTVYVYSGDLSSGGNPICSYSNQTGAYVFEKIEILPYNLSNHPFKVLIAASPVNLSSTNSHLFELDVDVNLPNCIISFVPDNTGAFANLNLDVVDHTDEGVTAIAVNQVNNLLYAATVRNNPNDPIPVKSHLYKTSYDPSTGIINPGWTDISGNMPNKTITFLSIYDDTSNTCNYQYVYGVLRGLGAWKFEENPIMITSSGGPVCNGTATASATTNDPFGGSSTYLWSTGATTNSISGIGVGTYTVTVSSGTGCSATNYVTIMENPHCCNTFENYVHPANFDNATITGEFNLNESVVCNGIVILDGATLSIKEGVSITVPVNSQLHIINGSELFACGNMWAGIVVEDGGELFIDNLDLKDAQYGTSVMQNGNLILRNSTYDHNYVGVLISDLSTGTVIIDGTTFSCNDCLGNNPLKGSYPGQWPEPKVVTYAGIEAFNSVFNIGVSGSATNHFTGLYRGLSLENCFNTVLNSDFKNMTDFSFYSNPGGYGIYSEMAGGGLLRQFGMGELNNSPVSFENCPTAIFTNGGGVSVIANHMTGVRKGVSINCIKGMDATVQNNLIHASEEGVLMVGNEKAANVNVNFNTIVTNGVLCSGISVYESNQPDPLRKFRIKCNSISLQEGIFGIHLNIASNISILNNNITLHSIAYPQTGVALDGSSKCFLLENTVTGINTSLHTAFSGQIASNNNFTLNHSHLTKYGFDFASDCVSDELFKGNTMGEHETGLHINGSGILGVQTHRGNEWTGPFSAWGAQNENTVFNEVFFNPVTVHEPTPGSLFHPTNNVPVGAQWFVFDPFGTPWTGFYTNPCNVYLVIGGDDNQSKYTYTDTLVVNDSIVAVQFEDELKYFTSRSLLEKLSKNDSLRNDDGLFENYYDSKAGTPRSELTNISLKLQSEIPTELIQGKFMVISSGMDSLMILDSLLISDTTYTSYRENLLGIIKLEIDTARLQSDLFNSTEDSIFNIANTLNVPVIPANDIELYEKQVNEFYFAYRDSLLYQVDSLDLSNLTFIASQCPYAYGKAVFRARAELARYGIYSFYNDKFNCTQLGYFRHSQQVSVSVNRADNGNSIFPNPANTKINFVIANEQDVTHIDIRDVTGKLVLTSIAPKIKEFGSIDVSILNQGLYSITFSGLNILQYKSKFSIVR